MHVWVEECCGMPSVMQTHTQKLIFILSGRLGATKHLQYESCNLCYDVTSDHACLEGVCKPPSMQTLIHPFEMTVSNNLGPKQACATIQCDCSFSTSERDWYHSLAKQMMHQTR